MAAGRKHTCLLISSQLFRSVRRRRVFHTPDLGYVSVWGTLPRFKNSRTVEVTVAITVHPIVQCGAITADKTRAIRASTDGTHRAAQSSP
jgi:hypothetical protein